MPERKLGAPAPSSQLETGASDEVLLPVAAHRRTRQQKRDGTAAAVDALLDVDQVGEQLNCTTRMARELIARRWLPITRIGRLVRVAQSDLDAYKSACRQPASTGPLAESQAR